MPLSAREVEQRGRDLTKAAAQPSSSASVLTLIGELRTGVVATEEFLRSTKIGVTVNKLKAHSDKTVASAASTLVSKWRSDVGKGRGGVNAPGSGASTPRVGDAKAAVRNGASPAPKSAVASPSVKAEKVVLKVAKEKRNAGTDGVNTKVTDNQTRDSCIKLMYDGLAFMSEESPDSILKVARSVEAAAYTTFPDASTDYRIKMRSLFQNLKNKSNQSLRDGVLDGSIPPARFVKMTHDELKSAERKAEDEKLIKENLKDAMVARDMKAVSTQLRCGKCGQKKVSYTQAQTRSADEPMTTFCECLHCGNRWKFS